MHVKDTSAPPLIAELILHCTHFGRGKITQNDDYKWIQTYSAQQESRNAGFAPWYLMQGKGYL